MGMTISQPGGGGGGGAAGPAGPPGDSAYQIAVANGFVGNEAAWLASLQGATGATGATGPAGTGVAVLGSGESTAGLPDGTIVIRMP